jgi:hypothetical protein
MTIEKNNTTLEERAVTYLLARGKHLGIDFVLADAVDTANTIALAETVRAKIEHERPSGYFGFEGNECCRGWDGESSRCFCGNRRVSWGTEQYVDLFDEQEPASKIYGYAH